MAELEPSPESPSARAPSEAEGPPMDAHGQDGAGWDRRARWLLFLAHLLLLSGAFWVGPTFDEHYYIASGYSYWQTGDFALNREHPPLVKLMVGLPLLFAPDISWSEHAPQLVSFPRTWFFQINGEQMDFNLFLARTPMCLATVMLGWMVYRTARRLFSARAAFFALAAFVLNPTVLAHGRLAGLDGGLSVFLFLAVLSFGELMTAFGWRRLVLAGVLFGLANLAKFTALLLVPFGFAVALFLGIRRKSMVPIGALIGTWSIGLTVFAAGYGFEAKSVAQVGAQDAYFERGSDRESDATTPARLARSARAAGLEPERVQRVSAAEGATDAVAEITAGLSATDRERLASLVALRSLRGAGGPLRKQAFHEVMQTDAWDAETLDTLSSLARVQLSRSAAWRDWYVANRDTNWDRTLFSNALIEALTRGVFGDERPIPLLSAFKGIDYQLRHGSEGHGTYFRGESIPAGSGFADGNPHPEYYVVTWAVKNPISFTLVVLLGLGVVLRERKRWALARLLTLVGFPIALLAMFSFGNALMGVKYLLPIFPFAALWLAAAVHAFPRIGAGLAILAVLEGSVLLPESSPTHPHELMYYNALAGGPIGGPWTTVLGDDWGQDARAVGGFAQLHADSIRAAGGLHYEPYTRADLQGIGLGEIRRVEREVEGIVAVHVIDYYRDAERFAWLRDYEPFLQIGWSVYVYDTREGAPGGNPLPEWKLALE